MTVLNLIINTHIEKQKKKEGSKEERKDLHNDDDEDFIIHQASDDEKEEGSNFNSQQNIIADTLIKKISNLENNLTPDYEGTKMVNSVNDAPFVPLGQQRLRSVELVLSLIKLRHQGLLTAMCNSEVFTNIIKLV